MINDNMWTLTNISSILYRVKSKNYQYKYLILIYIYILYGYKIYYY